MRTEPLLTTTSISLTSHSLNPQSQVWRERIITLMTQNIAHITHMAATQLALETLIIVSFIATFFNTSSADVYAYYLVENAKDLSTYSFSTFENPSIYAGMHNFFIWE